MSVQEALERSHAPAEAPAETEASHDAKGSDAIVAADGGTGGRTPVALPPARFRLPETVRRWGIRTIAIAIAVAIWHLLTAYDFV